MQLDKIVSFHKAVGDPTRMRIIAILRQGPLHGQAIAHKLGLKPPTITHHISKLREVSLIYQRREGNTIYFYLDETKLEFNAKAILRLGETTMLREAFQIDAEEKLSLVKNFFTKDGKLKSIPSKQKKKLLILAYMIRNIESGRKYEESEINDYIKQFHDDYATIRREWIMHQFMYRENNIYELNPEEMWPIVY